MSAHPQDLPTTPLDNLWTCQICRRLRACPYKTVHLPDVLNYVGCSCGDAAVDESSADAAERAAALRYLIANKPVLKIQPSPAGRLSYWSS